MLRISLHSMSYLFNYPENIQALKVEKILSFLSSLGVRADCALLWH
jgi:hypothetical protein